MIIVTGAAGFIGRNLVAALNSRGRSDLLLVDRLGSDPRWSNLVGLGFEDLVQPDPFLRLIEEDRLPKVEAIIHLGACSATTERDAGYLLENNHHYSMRLAQWALGKGTRFVYASSAATYGDGALGYCDRDEVTPQLRPLNMYGYSKHLTDLWALRGGFFGHLVGLKYFNVYGPFEDHKAEMRSVVHRAFHQIREQGVVKLFRSYRPDYGDGEQQRDFIHVGDAVDVTLHFALDSRAGGLFNCGTGQARSWNDLARALFTAMGREPRIEYIDMPGGLRGAYQYFTQADPAKLRAAGYAKAFRSLEQGVADYVRDHLQPRATAAAAGG
jgi:ADP-L-glycero-D-manno-heptose 6-epimerase